MISRMCCLIVLIVVSVTTELPAEDATLKITPQMILAELNKGIGETQALQGTNIENVSIQEEAEISLVELTGKLAKEDQRGELEKLVVRVLNVLNKQAGANMKPVMTEIRVALPELSEVKPFLTELISGEKSLSHAQLRDLRYERDNGNVWIVFDATVAFPFQSDRMIAGLNGYFDDVFGPSDEAPGKPRAKRGEVIVAVPDASSLVEALQTATVTDFELGSVLVCDGMYETIDGSDAFVLDARAGSADEVSEAIAEFNNLIDARYGTEWPRVHPSGFEVVEYSPGKALDQRAFGIDLFYRGRITEAQTAFRHAIVDAPDDLVSRYWHVLCDLKLGRSEIAYEQIEELVREQNKSFNSSQRYLPVLRSFERIQGPLRMELHRLETQAKLECGFAMRSAS